MSAFYYSQIKIKQTTEAFSLLFLILAVLIIYYSLDSSSFCTYGDEKKKILKIFLASLWTFCNTTY